MTARDDVQDFLDEVGARLDAGAREYGDQSFVRPVAETERQILEESIDQVGWLYVLWCQAARKTEMVRDQATLRQLFRVLDNRYHNCRPTLLVSNLPSAQFAEMMGSALLDRLCEGGGGKVLFEFASQRNVDHQRGDVA